MCTEVQRNFLPDRQRGRLDDQAAAISEDRTLEILLYQFIMNFIYSHHFKFISTEYVNFKPTFFTYITHQSAYHFLVLVADDVTALTTHYSSRTFSKTMYFKIRYEHNVTISNNLYLAACCVVTTMKYKIFICHINAICLVKCYQSFGAACRFHIQIMCNLEVAELQGYM
jgi:hypothetical protein